MIYKVCVKKNVLKTCATRTSLLFIIKKPGRVMEILSDQIICFQLNIGVMLIRFTISYIVLHAILTSYGVCRGATTNINH